MMKLANMLLILQATASAKLIRLGSPRVSDGEDNANVGLYFGSVRYMYTPVVASHLVNATGLVSTDVEDLNGTWDFDAFDSVIVGGPTYNTGEMNHRSTTAWDDWLYEVLPTLDVRGKKIAIFGTGKQAYLKTPDADHWSGYPENFGDALGEMYDRLSEAGAQMYGFTDGTNTDPAAGGYNFTRSKFIRNGQFMGQMFDQRSQPELSEGRANAWIEQLRNEGFFSKSADKRTGGAVKAE